MSDSGKIHAWNGCGHVLFYDNKLVVVDIVSGEVVAGFA